MSKLSFKEKLILNFIVTNCEIYTLNEEEALEYILFNFSKPISRRTYYNYKKMILGKCSFPYEKHGEHNKRDLRFNNLPKISNFINCKELKAILLLNAKRDLIQKGLETDIYLSDFDKLNFFPRRLINSLNNAKSVITHSEEFLGKLKQRRQINDTNHKLHPGNVSIRQEYIKCDKESCKGCRHGPYYYGYWREKDGKLKKKYIGISE